MGQYEEYHFKRPAKESVKNTSPNRRSEVVTEADLNVVETDVGDLTLLTTTAADLVAAINALDARLTAGTL